ncbi:hypothetical protein [Streptomyces luteireticuli]|uniref:HNH endonuclease n=1 Tax=Streptomyces luteireticuli TaxID=173858 RepID=A0ABN0Z9A1_9ACTN
MERPLLIQCPRCEELVAKGRAPEFRRGGGSAALYALTIHHMEDHGTTGEPLPNCKNCQYWVNPYGLRQDLVEWFSAQHFVRHVLGIVSDGLGYPLRFEDMPARKDYWPPNGHR